jgi:hypothetical protein
MEFPKKLHKRKEKIRLLRRLFTPLLKKNYSFSIKMSTRIKRLSLEMLHYEEEFKNDAYRKESSRKGGAENTY